MRVTPLDVFQPLLLTFDYRRVDQRVKARTGRGILSEDDISQNPPIDCSVRREYPRAEFSYDSRVHGLSRIKELVRDFVGIDQIAAQINEHCANRAFAGSNAASQADSQH